VEGHEGWKDTKKKNNIMFFLRASLKFFVSFHLLLEHRRVTCQSLLNVTSIGRISGVIVYARMLLRGGEFRPPPLLTFDAEVGRFHATLAALQRTWPTTDSRRPSPTNSFSRVRSPMR